MSGYFKILLFLISSALLAPLVFPVFAADSGPGPAGIPLIEYMFARVVCVTVPLGYIALLVILIIAGFKYLISGGEPKAISSAHQTVTWGILGILFLAIAWLILLLIQNFTGVKVTQFTLSSLPGVQGFTGSCWAEPPVAPNPTPKPQPIPQPVAANPSSSPVTTFTPSAPTPSVGESCDTSREDHTVPDGPVNYVDNSLGYPVHINLADGSNIGELLSSPSQYQSNPTPLGAVYRGSPYLDRGFADIIAQQHPRQINYLEDASDGLFRYATRAGADRINTLMHSVLPRNTFIVYLKIRTSLTIEPISSIVAGLNDRLFYPGSSAFMKVQKGFFPRGLAEFTHLSFLTIKQYLETHPNGLGPDSKELLDNTDWDATYLFGFRSKCADYYLGIADSSPLIYLYPQNPLSISVNINSPIISSKLSLYNNFWSVSASPDGTLITLDGKKYPYIPYEFLRNDFKKPEKGIVIEGSKLEDYLRKDLWKKLGLKENEIGDYWIDAKPRIPKANYYFVSLIDRSEIDRVLPMEVNPKPDTIIRNMTYILPLSAPFTLQPLEEEKLIAPQRNGFTVLENGVFTDGF